MHLPGKKLANFLKQTPHSVIGLLISLYIKVVMGCNI